jgi:hypothetical protein
MLSKESLAQLTIPNHILTKSLGSRDNLVQISQNIYATLIEFDTTPTRHIWTESFPPKGLGEAIMDKLVRASQATATQNELSKNKL